MRLSYCTAHGSQATHGSTARTAVKSPGQLSAMLLLTLLPTKSISQCTPLSLQLLLPKLAVSNYSSQGCRINRANLGPPASPHSSTDPTHNCYRPAARCGLASIPKVAALLQRLYVQLLAGQLHSPKHGS